MPPQTKMTYFLNGEKAVIVYYKVQNGVPALTSYTPIN